MNAKELAEKVRRIQAPEFPIVMRSTLNQLAEDIATDIEQLIPAYRPPRPEDDGKYCFIEALGKDHEPLLVKYRQRWHWQRGNVVSWQYQLHSGTWRDIEEGEKIWPCERPE